MIVVAVVLNTQTRLKAEGSRAKVMAHPAQNPADDPIIKCTGLQKWYGAVHALKNVDFHAGRGEVIGLVGDNGAGKSTLIKILSGVHTQDQGEILIDGHAVSITGPGVAMSLGIETIYQYTAMVPEMSIAQNFFMGASEPLGNGGAPALASSTAQEWRAGDGGVARGVGAGICAAPTRRSRRCRAASGKASPSRAPCISVQRC